MAKFKDKHLLDIVKWAEEGFADYQIAHNLGVANSTFAFWKKTKPELAILLEKARAPKLLEVVDALYRIAIGYDTIETSVEKCGARKVIKKVKKAYPPNVKAISMILTNRMPDEWTASQRIGVDVKGMVQTGELDVSKLTDDQLAAIGAALGTVNDSSDGK